MLINALSFLVALAILIVVHEWGHYRVARACGVRVLRFSVGFGRVLWRRRGPSGTEFTLSAIPLGGYVRMLDEREGAVPPELRHECFNTKPLRQRAAIVAAGPIANLLLAVLLFTLAGWWGQEQPKAVLGTPQPGGLAAQAGLRVGDWVQAVSRDGREWVEVRAMPDLAWQLTQAVGEREALHLMVSDARGHGRRALRLETDKLTSRDMSAQTLRQIGLGGPLAEPVLGPVTAGGPADLGGLQPGDRVLRIEGELMVDAAQVRDRIRRTLVDGRPQLLHLQLQRSGQVIERQVLPKLVEQGGQGFAQIQVAVGAAPEMVMVRYGVLESVQQGLQRCWDLALQSLKVMGRMIIGEASVKNLSGPLTIADYAGQSARLGVAQSLGFLAIVSVSLGVLNLLPVPMLDGGHLMYYLFEGLSGRPVSEWWHKQLQRLGVAVLLLMMSLALSNDLTRYLGLH